MTTAAGGVAGLARREHVEVPAADVEAEIARPTDMYAYADSHAKTGMMKVK